MFQEEFKNLNFIKFKTQLSYNFVSKPQYLLNSGNFWQDRLFKIFFDNQIYKLS